MKILRTKREISCIHGNTVEYLEVSRREYFHHGTVNKKFDGSSIGDEVTKGSLRVGKEMVVVVMVLLLLVVTKWRIRESTRIYRYTNICMCIYIYARICMHVGRWLVRRNINTPGKQDSRV